jgi:hypothetical protein
MVNSVIIIRNICQTEDVELKREMIINHKLYDGFIPFMLSISNRLTIFINSILEAVPSSVPNIINVYFPSKLEFNMVGHICVIVHSLSKGRKGRENNMFSIDSFFDSKLINYLIVVLKMSSFIRANNNFGKPKIKPQQNNDENNTQKEKMVTSSSSSSISLPSFPSLPAEVMFTPPLLMCVDENQTLTMKIFTMYKYMHYAYVHVFPLLLLLLLLHIIIIFACYFYYFYPGVLQQ